MLQLWHRLQLQHGFDPWPGKFHIMLQGLPKKKKRRKEGRKERKKGERERKKGRKGKKEKFFPGIFLWHSRLRIQRCHCRVLGQVAAVVQIQFLPQNSCMLWAWPKSVKSVLIKKKVNWEFPLWLSGN